ncbi:lantibiotic dehydratase [Streptomyces sp. NPDC048331]|uniref:lantibiotic dehydratase n=1 Tax=Streptomyces sp. NPDC048331 TaxID=3365534 RepID=UPI0037244127
MARGARLYRHTQALMVRATTYPASGAPEPNVNLHGPDGLERGRAWLATVWDHPQARRALEAASPVLAAQTATLLALRTPSGKEIRRLVHSTAAYLLRWQGRATPFGHFAGVAPARIGPAPQALWGTGHRAVLRPDAAWLGAVTDQLAAHPDVQKRLLVVANPAAHVRGGRIVVPGRAPADGLAPLEVSMAATGPVRSALAAATSPVAFPDVAKAVADRYPHADHALVHGLLAHFLEYGVLLSALDATATAADPLAQIRTLTDPASTPAPLLSPTAEVTGSTPPAWPDTVLDAQVTIPASVLSEAETAASVLARLSPYPFGNPAWKDFHQRFRQTYGVGAAVPVTELVGDGGLGFPPGFLGADRPAPARMLSARDEAFLAVAQQAALDGACEVVLTERLVASLAVVEAAELALPPTVELAFQLRADDADALRRGRFELWLASAARPSSSMAGRFTDLLADTNATELAAALAGPAGPLPAQLVFPARRHHSANVIRTPHLLEHSISLSWPEPGPGSIPLDDLAVTSDTRNLYLIRTSTGQAIEPRVLHALEPRVLTAPLARFLAEVAGARRAVWRLPDWGAASRLPFLPRLRHGRTVLAPARWLLAATSLPGPAATLATWEGAFERWRDRQGVPAHVILTETEMRLPLDLDVPLHRELLRARLARALEVEVREAPALAAGSTSSSAGGFMGRAHEFLTILHATTPVPFPAGPAVAVAEPQTPGVSRTLCAHLHGHPARQDEILTEHLPRLFDGWSPAPAWWFTRHDDAAHPDRDRHLALILHLDDATGYGRAAERLGTWADELRRHQLASRLDLAAYRPQDGRYGHGPAREASERVFAADSAAALAQITYAAHAGVPAEALAAASLAELATAFAPCPADGWSWLAANLPRETGPVDGALTRHTLALTAPGAAWRHEPDALAVVETWAARTDALCAYRQTIDAQREPMTVLRSLLHHHHVRALGGGPDSGRITHRLARSAALPHTHRRKARP